MRKECKAHLRKRKVVQSACRFYQVPQSLGSLRSGGWCSTLGAEGTEGLEAPDPGPAGLGRDQRVQGPNGRVCGLWGSLLGPWTSLQVREVHRTGTGTVGTELRHYELKLMCVSYTRARTNTCLVYVIIALFSPFGPYAAQRKASDLQKHQGPRPRDRKGPGPSQSGPQPLVPEDHVLGMQQREPLRSLRSLPWCGAPEQGPKHQQTTPPPGAGGAPVPGVGECVPVARATAVFGWLHHSPPLGTASPPCWRSPNRAWRERDLLRRNRSARRPGERFHRM